MEVTQDAYKDTKIGRIPMDWEVVRQAEVATFYNGRAFKLSEWEDNGTPVIRLQNLTGFGKNYYYSNLKLPEYQYCRNGDLLYMWSASFGPVWWSGEKAIFHYHIWRIEHIENKFDKVFHYYLLDNITRRMKSQSHGSTMLHVTKGGMEKLMIQLPPLKEQQKIAEILSTVDEQISTTDKVIEKSKELKKGLMQKLFSEGIGHTEFKDTKIGRIPKDWEVVKIMDVAENHDSKRVPIKSADRANMSGEYPYYGAQGIIDWVNQYLFDGDYLLVAEDGENVKSQKNDIAFLVCGKFWVNNHAHVLKCKRGYSQIFLSYYLNQLNIRKYVSGSAQPKLNKGTLMKIQVITPSLFEQQKIGDILSEADAKIKKEQTQKAELEALKKGLMQQLLTGKKRVVV